MSSLVEIQVIALLISIACALPSCFLVLRNMAMMTDSISHTVLLGITLTYLITENLDSPLLILGATLMGVFTVWLSELLGKGKLISADSAIALVFPLLFSIAIILISKHAHNIHLDVDAVMLGELAFAPFDRLVIHGHDLGAKGLYQAGTLLIFNCIFLTVLFKELKISTFDPILSMILGFSPLLLHYSLMTVVSVTAVVAFQSVGSILVIAFMVVPANTALLLSHDLKKILWLSGFFAAISALIGFPLAYAYDVSIAGTIAMVSGALFALVFVFSPQEGLLLRWHQRQQQALAFAQYNLLFHVASHEKTGAYREENGLATLPQHLYWNKRKCHKIAFSLVEKGDLTLEEGILYLSEQGRSFLPNNPSAFAPSP